MKRLLDGARLFSRTSSEACTGSPLDQWQRKLGIRKFLSLRTSEREVLLSYLLVRLIGGPEEIPRLRVRKREIGSIRGLLGEVSGSNFVESILACAMPTFCWRLVHSKAGAHHNILKNIPTAVSLVGEVCILLHVELPDSVSRLQLQRH